jgi:hypothetical protein
MDYLNMNQLYNWSGDALLKTLKQKNKLLYRDPDST